MKQFLAGVALAISAVVAHADPVTITSVDHGWYRSNGFHIPSNANTLTGYSAGLEHRSFYAFDLGFVGAANIKSMFITFTSRNGTNSGTRSKELVLYDFVGSVGALLDGTAGVDAWADLGSGMKYGSATVTKTSSTAAPPMPTITMQLSDYAIADALRAIANSTRFVIGASLLNPILLPNDVNALWSSSGGVGTAARLTLELEVPVEVPEPSPVALIGAGLAGLIWVRRRNDTRQLA